MHLHLALLVGGAGMCTTQASKSGCVYRRVFIASVITLSRPARTISRNSSGPTERVFLLTICTSVQCGWCGAINPRTRKSKSKGEDGASTSKATSKCGRCLDKTESFLEQTLCCEGSDTGNNWFQWVCTLVVAFTSALIATIGIFGAYPVLHDSNSSPFWYVVNTAVAIVLEVNIFFNYYGAVLRPAGAVQDFYDLTEVPPSRNCFDSFTYCQKCASSSPLCVLWSQSL